MAGERQEWGKGFSTSPTIIRDQRLHTEESYHKHSQQRVQFQSWLFSSRHQHILQDTNVQLCSPGSHLPNIRTDLYRCWLPPPLHPETCNESWPGDLLALLSPPPSSHSSQPRREPRPISLRPGCSSLSAPNRSQRICISHMEHQELCYSRKPVNNSLPRVQK